MREYKYFAVELDALLARNRASGSSAVPWEEMYTAIRNIYFSKISKKMYEAAFYAYSKRAL